MRRKGLSCVAACVIFWAAFPIKGQQIKPSWEIDLPTTYKAALFKPSGETLHETRGVAEWDANNLLAFVAEPTGELQRRVFDADTASAWNLAVFLVSKSTGKIVGTHHFPLRSSSDQVAVVEAGIIIVDSESINLIDHSLQIRKQVTTYHSLTNPESLVPIPLAHLRPPSIYVSPDKRHLAIVDRSNYQGRVIILDSVSCQTGAAIEIHHLSVEAFSIGNDGFIFSAEKNGRYSVHIGDFSGSIREIPQTSKSTNDSTSCIVPYFLTVSTFLNTCGELYLESTIAADRTPLKATTVTIPDSGVLSPTLEDIGILKRTVKGGGLFDTTEKQTLLEVQIVSFTGRPERHLQVMNQNAGLVRFAFLSKGLFVVLTSRSLSMFVLQ